MIREVDTLEAPGLLPPSSRMAESVEHEINRLTWSVLDGSATPGDRNRLAELVRAQHSHRPRTVA
jgi:hypothetical protein